MLSKNGMEISGVAKVGGSPVMKAAIKLAEDQKCGPIVGSLNYPSRPDGVKELIVLQFTYAGIACGASPVAAEISVDNNHPLAAFKPTTLVWAAFVKVLSFSGSPMIALKAPTE